MITKSKKLVNYNYRFNKEFKKPIKIWQESRIKLEIKRMETKVDISISKKTTLNI